MPYVLALFEDHVVARESVLEHNESVANAAEMIDPAP
jgi:hypothetical protein